MRTKAQTTLEYAVLITCVVAALIAMQIYIKRAKGGNLRQAADSLGEQYSPIQTLGGANFTSSSNTSDTTKTMSEWEANQTYGAPFDFDADGNPNEFGVYATEVRSRLLESTQNQAKNETVQQFGRSLFED